MVLILSRVLSIKIFLLFLNKIKKYLPLIYRAENMLHNSNNVYLGHMELRQEIFKYLKFSFIKAIIFKSYNEIKMLYLIRVCFCPAVHL